LTFAEGVVALELEILDAAAMLELEILDAAAMLELEILDAAAMLELETSLCPYKQPERSGGPFAFALIEISPSCRSLRRFYVLTFNRRSEAESI